MKKRQTFQEVSFKHEKAIEETRRLRRQYSTLKVVLFRGDIRRYDKIHGVDLN